MSNFQIGDTVVRRTNKHNSNRGRIIGFGTSKGVAQVQVYWNSGVTSWHRIELLRLVPKAGEP